MTQSQPPITRTTHTLPFDKLSSRDFERLCLWLVEREGYERAKHLGAAPGLPKVGNALFPGEGSPRSQVRRLSPRMECDIMKQEVMNRCLPQL